MAEHAHPGHASRATEPQKRAASDTGAIERPTPGLKSIEQHLNRGPKVVALKRDAERLNARGQNAVAPVQRMPAAAFTKQVPLPSIAGGATIQRFQLRQTTEAGQGISDLHYRYDDQIGGNAQANEFLHITVVYRPAVPAGQPQAAEVTRHCYYNYATTNWRWDAAPPANVSGIANGYRAAAVQWASAHHQPAPPPAAPQQVPANNLNEFPRLGR